MTDWNAYHFVGDTLRDGRPVPADGEKLVHTGELKMCATGLHASRKPWQALEYAPGHTLCRVHCGGEIIEPKGEDKLVCTERTIIARIDATDLLWSFARKCALDVIHLWDAPDVVREYLETGDESLQEVAWAAARAASWASRASRAAWAASRAAWAASQASRASRTSRASRAAAWEAWEAAWEAREAAREALLKKQRARFTAMVNKAFGS